MKRFAVSVALLLVTVLTVNAQCLARCIVAGKPGHRPKPACHPRQPAEHPTPEAPCQFFAENRLPAITKAETVNYVAVDLPEALPSSFGTPHAGYSVAL